MSMDSSYSFSAFESWTFLNSCYCNYYFWTTTNCTQNLKLGAWKWRFYAPHETRNELVRISLDAKMIEIKAWNHLEMNLMTWKNSGSWKICQALNNICKTLLHCFSKQAAEAEEKSQVVIQKSSASFSNGKNDDRAQNSQLLNLLLSATRFLPALFHLKRVRQALCQFVNSWENAFHLRERSEQLVFSIFISKSWVWKKRGKLISRFFFQVLSHFRAKPAATAGGLT